MQSQVCLLVFVWSIEQGWILLRLCVHKLVGLTWSDIVLCIGLLLAMIVSRMGIECIYWWLDLILSIFSSEDVIHFNQSFRRSMHTAMTLITQSQLQMGRLEVSYFAFLVILVTSLSLLEWFFTSEAWTHTCLFERFVVHCSHMEDRDSRLIRVPNFWLFFRHIWPEATISARNNSLWLLAVIVELDLWKRLRRLLLLFLFFVFDCFDLLVLVEFEDFAFTPAQTTLWRVLIWIGLAQGDRAFTCV